MWGGLIIATSRLGMTNCERGIQTRRSERDGGGRKTQLRGMVELVNTLFPGAETLLLGERHLYIHAEVEDVLYTCFYTIECITSRA